jgi:hypothetical protein
MNIEKFEDFLNERSRAERKLDRVERKANKAKKDFEEGNDERGKKRMSKAKKNLDKAKALDSNIDTKEIESEIDEIEKTDWEKELDVSTSLLGRKVKVKAKDLEYITKLKVKGDEISPEELVIFLKTVKSYLNEYWDEIQDENDTEEYLSTHSDDMVIDVKHRGRRVVFKYNEGRATDKIKLVVDKDLFEDEDNKKPMVAEIDMLVGTKSLTSDKKDGKLANNYRKEKDDKIVTPIVVGDVISKEINTKVANKVGNVNGTTNDTNNKVTAKVKKVVNEVTIPDKSFSSSTVELLINEKLNIGMRNTNEDKIFDWFIKNKQKTLNANNIDTILTEYKQKKAMMNESFIEDGIEGAKRALNSVTDTSSEGVVKDLMNAFNTDAKTVSKDINSMLSKLSNAYGDKLMKEVEKTASKIKSNPDKYVELSEDFSAMDMGSGALLGAGVGRTIAKRQLGKQAVKTVGKRALLGRLAGGSTSLLGLGGLSITPVGWVIIGVIIASSLWYFLYNTFDEQQHKIAHIFILMWASQSPKFLQEMKVAGIRINESIKPNIDNDKLQSILNEPIQENKDFILMFESFTKTKY